MRTHMAMLGVAFALGGPAAPPPARRLATK